MNNKRDMVLNFTNAMSYVKDYVDNNLAYLDFSDLKGTDMYCNPEAEQYILSKLKEYSISGIHFLDSGNYHYVTRLFVNRIKEPFSLVLFDHHNDMQQPMIHDLTSCGCWARQVLEENQYLKQLIVIGPSQKTIDEIDITHKEKLICISIQDFEQHHAKEKMKLIDQDYPVYISIDKDVLSRAYARTNWNQGTMSLSLLEQILDQIILRSKIIGVDICGEYTDVIHVMEYMEAERINQETNRKLYEYIKNDLQKIAG